MVAAQARTGMLREPLRAVLHDVHVQMKDVLRPYLQVAPYVNETVKQGNQL